jgi:PhnB protein
MKYMLLIYSDEKAWTESEREHCYAESVGDGLAAGVMSVQEPIKKDDEDKRGGVKDAGGTTWWLATKVK